MSTDVTSVQIKLIAQAINAILQVGPFVTPYMSLGVNVGQCIFCSAVGEVRSDLTIIYAHHPECVFVLNAVLQ